MKSIEDYMAEKIEDLINYVLSKIIKPDMKVENVRELDKEKITELKRVCNIEGIILDLDETLIKDMRMLPRCNQEWIEYFRGQLKIIIVSNGYDRDIKNYFEERGIDYIGFAHKPLKINLLKACKKMQLDPTKVMIVGDRLWDDIYGGKKNNMYTTLVKSVEDER